MTESVKRTRSPGVCPACGTLIPACDIDGARVECPRCRCFRDVAEVVLT